MQPVTAAEHCTDAQLVNEIVFRIPLTKTSLTGNCLDDRCESACKENASVPQVSTSCKACSTSLSLIRESQGTSVCLIYPTTCSPYIRLYIYMA